MNQRAQELHLALLRRQRQPVPHAPVVERDWRGGSRKSRNRDPTARVARALEGCPR